jgi:hypothetical protein
MDLGTDDGIGTDLYSLVELRGRVDNRSRMDQGEHRFILHSRNDRLCGTDAAARTPPASELVNAS